MLLTTDVVMNLLNTLVLPEYSHIVDKFNIELYEYDSKDEYLNYSTGVRVYVIMGDGNRLPGMGSNNSMVIDDTLSRITFEVRINESIKRVMDYVSPSHVKTIFDTHQYHVV